MRFIVEKMRTPRALYVDFPLGWPVGQPLDADFQHRVLQAAFALLARPGGPVLEDFPERIESQPGEPLSCPMPARFNPDLHPAVDEAQALRNAYDRAVKKNGRTSVGRVITADQIPEALEKFVRIAEGEPWDQQGLGLIMMVVHDIRAYYEELAFEIADGPIAAYGAERWFFDETEAGKVLISARRSMRQAGAPHAQWYFITPGSRQ
jgi:hypothetical protein|tara:strand:- start:423 stop:1043 length:621 start_codon:yes stop_codon:yes gene_type:complete